MRKEVFHLSLAVMRTKWYTCQRSSFVYIFTWLGASNRSEIRGSGYQSFFVILLRPWKSTQRWREPSFLRMKSMGVAWVEEDGRMKPDAKCSSKNVRRASSSIRDREYRVPNGGCLPSSSSIFRSYSWCGARVLALLLLNTSANSWYAIGMAERLTASGSTEVEWSSLVWRGVLRL